MFSFRNGHKGVCWPLNLAYADEHGKQRLQNCSAVEWKRKKTGFLRFFCGQKPLPAFRLIDMSRKLTEDGVRRAFERLTSF